MLIENIKVQELIDELNKIKDKEQFVRFEINYSTTEPVEVVYSSPYSRDPDDYDYYDTEVEVEINKKFSAADVFQDFDCVTIYCEE